MKINGYPIEIMQVKNNMVKTARIAPPPIGDPTIQLFDDNKDG
jgi:Mg2+/Co2+ transporter CorB